MISLSIKRKIIGIALVLIVLMTITALLSVALGIFPGTLLLSWMEPSVTGLVNVLATLGGR